MRGPTLFAFAVMAGLLIVASPMLAHHGQTNWDSGKTLKLAGTVTSFNWVNPHVSIEWAVKTSTGETEHWVAELTSPGNLQREGWHHDSVKAGDEITITCHPAKNGQKFVSFQKLEFADGRRPLGAGQGETP